MGKLISAHDLRVMAADARQVTIPAGSVLTPSALDMAKEQGIALMYEAVGAKTERTKTGATEMLQPASPASVGPPVIGGMPADAVREIVRRVVAQVIKPACDKPRLTHVKAAGVVLEPFPEAPPGQKIMLKDVVTAREGNLAAGFMTFEASQLPWHLAYDEVDYVVEGIFTLQAGGKTYTLGPGDVMYIPKDTKVVFGSPSRAKVFYVTYPANWADLKE